MMLFKKYRGFTKAVQLFQKQCLRGTTICGCTDPPKTIASTHTGDKTKKVVYISNSRNIFENLALEEWLYENVDMKDTDFLLMWRNGPAVVIGRHQNPWLECDVLEAGKRGILLARRNSGGGTVFHDEGNLNLSFMMHRSRYDRRRNLSLVVQALTSRWDIDLDLNCRDDLVLDGVYKVSGTASKLGGNRTYHHFTLVVDVDRDVLSSILYSPVLGADSKATKSIPSPVKNLKEDAPDMTCNELFHIIAQHFVGKDREKEFAVVDPTDESQFPGVALIRHRLGSWNWVFGKSPSFSITRTFAKTVHDSSTPYSQYSLRTKVVIEKGQLEDISLKLSGRLKGSSENTDLPFRLLEVLDWTERKLEERQMLQLWQRGQERLGEMKDAEDLDLLLWGLQCLMRCVPVGGGDFTEN